jgi:hypothetical protein
MGFEPTIPAFEGAKTVHALDPAATLIGTGKLIIFSYTNCLVFIFTTTINPFMIIQEKPMYKQHL